MMYRDDLIRAEKAAQKKTLEDLREITGLNKNTISDICNGKENVEVPTLKKVAEALNLPMSELFKVKGIQYRKAA
jgi:transcriptional regulator with XRE-family HTH domain